MPSKKLRELEVQANDAFDTYREMYDYFSKKLLILYFYPHNTLSLSCRYFEGGVSSVYMWDLDGGFAAVVLIKKGPFPCFIFSPPFHP